MPTYTITTRKTKKGHWECDITGHQMHPKRSREGGMFQADIRTTSEGGHEVQAITNGLSDLANKIAEATK